MKHYIFGYGSLILKESRDRSGNSLDWTAVRVKGLKRIWNDFTDYGISVLTVVNSEKDSCNGVLFEIYENDLNKFDQREQQYFRVKIPDHSITYLGNKRFKGTFWVYIQKENQLSHKLHALRTYVDVVLSGCFKISDEYANEFVDLTYCWPKIKDDRNKPEYPRSLKMVEYDLDIEELLKLKGLL